MSGGDGGRPSPGRSTVYTANPSRRKMVDHPARPSGVVSMSSACPPPPCTRIKLSRTEGGDWYCTCVPATLVQAGPVCVRSPVKKCPCSAMTRGSMAPLSPDLPGGSDQQLQLGALLADREGVAFDRGGEPALRRDAQPVDVHVLGGLLDASLERVSGLQFRRLRGHDPEHHDLVVRHEPQWLERPGPLVVVLEEQP